MNNFILYFLVSLALILSGCGTTLAPLKPDYTLDRSGKIVYIDEGLHDDIAINIVSRDWDDLDEDEPRTVAAVLKNQLYEYLEIQVKVLYFTKKDAVVEETEWMTFRLPPYKEQCFTVTPKEKSVDDYVIDMRYIR
jgi:hypothetical protein